MKSLTAALFLIAPLCGLGQTPAASNSNTTIQRTTPSATPEPVLDSAKVTVTSRGSDIRLVLTNIFAQAKKSLILQTNIQYSLYLSLQDTDFSKAVDVICEQAGLKYDVRDGIYHVYKKGTLPSTMGDAPSSASDSFGQKADAFSNAAPAPAFGKSGKLSLTVLKRKVSTKLAKAPIGAVLEELGAQAGVKIELGENVPAYRLDAKLNHTTLRYALEQVTRAAKLTYSFTDHHSILVDARS